MPSSTSWPLLGVVLLSACLNLCNNTFPLGYHHDEPKKVLFVRTGDQDFRHPILMLQLARVANALLGFDNDHQIAVLGRVITAACGASVVLLTYFLLQTILAPRWSLLSALGVAVSPTIVVHSHYFKEDMLFTACALLALLQFIKLVRDENASNTFWLGLATGLAASAQYKAVLLIPLYLAFPLFGKVRNLRRYYFHIGCVVVIAAYVFQLINWQMYRDLDQFTAGVSSEVHHILEGHSIRIYPLPQYFSFHLFNSLIPGMTWPVTLVALVSIAYVIVTWKQRNSTERLLVICVVGYYLAIESTPTKPAPDFERYAIPIVPLMIGLAYCGIARLWSSCPSVASRALTSALVMLTLVVPLGDTLALDYYLTRDTRAEAAKWLSARQGLALFEIHSGTHWDVWSVAQSTVAQDRAAGIAYLVTSSFCYDRYFRGSRLAYQPPEVYQIHAQYVKLFSYPYVEFRPRYRDFAFTNPVIRIIDIRQSKVLQSKP